MASGVGVQSFRHPIVGDLSLNYDALELPADPGQTIIAYSAEPGSPAQDALSLLMSWAPARDEPHTDPATDKA